MLMFTNRLFAMTITLSTPNIAYVRCSETELSLHLENGYMQLRPMKKYGNMIYMEICFAHVELLLR